MLSDAWAAEENADNVGALIDRQPEPSGPYSQLPTLRPPPPDWAAEQAEADQRARRLAEHDAD
jgi:hypothetical protein